MHRNLVLKTALIIAIIPYLGACAILKAEKPPRSPLRVAYTQWWGDYTLLVAQEKGLFEKYGVEVEPVYNEFFSKTYSNLASGQIDGALITAEDTININRNAHLKVVGVSDDGGADAIITGPDINNIEDLKGKTVGVLLGSQYEIAIANMLQSVKMNPGDINLANIKPENAFNALKNGQVQAVYTREPYLSQSLLNGNKIIYPNEKTRLFPYMIVFSASIVDDRPEDIRAFLKAWFEAVEYRLRNPQETQAIATQYLNLKILPDENLKVFSLEENKALFNIQDENSIYAVTQRTSEYLISIGVLAQQLDPLELIDPAFLP